MGGILSLVMIVLGAIFFFTERLSGNKKAAGQDELAGGAAWFVVFVIGISVSLLLLSFIKSYIETLDGPLHIIAQIIIGLIFVYIPYKIACLVVPAKDQDKKDKEKTT